MNAKVAETLMMGKTIFATPQALAGYIDLKDYGSVHLFNSPDEFIKQYKSTKTRRVNGNSRNYYEKYLSNKALLKNYASLLEI